VPDPDLERTTPQVHFESSSGVASVMVPPSGVIVMPPSVGGLPVGGPSSGGCVPASGPVVGPSPGSGRSLTQRAFARSQTGVSSPQSESLVQQPSSAVFWQV
jgi:hypothetical protein